MHKLVAIFLPIFISVAAQTAHGATELAKINNTVITLEDFNKKYKENLKFFQYKSPTKKGVLDDLIKRELGIQEAKRMGLDKDTEIIDRMNTVLYHALLDKKLSKEFEGIHISDDEAKDFYGKNPEVRTSHIFIAVPPDASADLIKKKLEQIKKIQSEHLKDPNASFAKVAQNHSEGVAAPVGGDIDYQTKDKLDPAYYEAAIKLKTLGKMSDIVRTQFGYHIIKLTGIRTWEDVDKAQVKRMLFDVKRTQIFDRYMNELRKQAKVSIRSDLIKE